ncbi:hypothetical protein OZX65_05725 [Leuconostocaceae bacterium ESL0723]|nr:hypothetical protein OZX65_05725 [Leuconostocaceae bacterium ESL0723]
MQATMDRLWGLALLKRANGIKANMKWELALGLVFTGIFLAFLHMPLLASTLGISAAKASSIITAVYRAYKAGSSMAAAVSAITGPGFLVEMALNIIFSFGIQQALNSNWVRNL